MVHNRDKCVDRRSGGNGCTRVGHTTREDRAEKNDLIESYVAEQVNTQLQRTVFKRNKRWVIIIYSFCCMMLIGFMLTYGNTAAPVVVAVIALLFVYLIYQQVRLDPPLLYGPRECGRCHRIVYRRTCPYCEPSG